MSGRQRGMPSCRKHGGSAFFMRYLITTAVTLITALSPGQPPSSTVAQAPPEPAPVVMSHPIPIASAAVDASPISSEPERQPQAAALTIDGSELVILSAGPDEYLVNQPNLKAVFQDSLMDMLSECQPVAYRAQSRLIGFRLSMVSQGSFFEHAGLKTGDVVMSLNDRPLKGWFSAIKAYKHAKRSPELSITILRDGAIRTLRYRFGSTLTLATSTSY